MRPGPLTQARGRYGASTLRWPLVCFTSILTITEALHPVRKLVILAVLAFCVLARAGAAAAVTANDYHIRVGDTLSITVFGETALSQNAVRVLPGGYVSVPLAGEVQIAGLTQNDASTTIAYALSRYLRYPR